MPPRELDPLDGRAPEMVFEAPAVGWDVADWSPDGKSLLVGRFVSVNTDFGGRFGLVYEMSPRDPGSCTVRASLDTPISKAAFSFDGKLLAFAAGAGGVYLYEFATKTLRKLDGLENTLGPGTPLYPEFREDGSLILPWLKDGGGILVVELEF